MNAASIPCGGVSTPAPATTIFMSGTLPPRLIPATPQSMLIWFLRRLPLITCLTRLTSTCFTESRSRASHSTMGTSGPRLSATLMSSGSNRGAPSKQLTAMMNGNPLCSK